MRKIAIPSDDGVTLSEHFGRASLYVVATVDGGKVTATETRPKAGRPRVRRDQREEEGAAEGESDEGHFGLASPIKDCQVVLAGGMGRRAYDHLRRLHIKPILTDIRNIDEALATYLTGTMQNRLDLLQ